MSREKRRHGHVPALAKVAGFVCFLALLLSPRPSWAGSWVITYSNTGNTTYDSVGPFGTMPYENYNYTSTASGANFNTGTGGVDSSVTASVTATLTWQPAYGQTNTTDPPPTQPVSILEIATAQENPGTWSGAGSPPASAGTASNGLGDTPVTSGRGYVCKGSHLIQRDGASGSIVLDPVSLSAVCPKTTVVNGKIDWLGSQAVSVNLTVLINSRLVTISANVDPTSKKVPLLDASGNQITDANGDFNYTSVPNTRDSDGTMYGDVGLSITALDAGDPENFTNIAYHANLGGAWQVYTSSYSWFSSLKQQGDSNTLSSPVLANDVIPDFTNSYLNPWYYDNGSPGMPAIAIASGETNANNPDHIFLKYTDGGNAGPYQGDGASATANYYMILHTANERNYADHVHSDFVNPRQVSANLISGGPTDTLGGGISIQVDYSLSASYAGPLGEWLANSIGLNLTVSEEKDYGTVSNVAATGLPVGWYTYVIETDHYYDHYGKVDNWGSEGYIGTSPYTLREIPKSSSDCVGLQMAPMQPGNMSSTVSP